MARPFWYLLGVVALAIGILGIFLPILPTTPLIILAAFAFGKGSPRIAAALEAHQVFGPIIAEWRRLGAIAPKFKAAAIVMMAAVLVFSIVMGFSKLVIGVQALCIAGAAAFILTRPSSGS